jgi:hypothetical protein
VLLCTAATLTACGSGGTKDTEGAETAVVAVTTTDSTATAKLSCDSFDPVAAVARPLDGATSVRVSYTFDSNDNGNGDITVNDTIERDPAGRVHYTTSPEPETFGVAYHEAIFAGDSLYVRFPDGAVAGADGLWVAVPLDDPGYVDELLQMERPTAGDTIVALFGENGSIAEVMSAYSWPLVEPAAPVRIETTDGTCSFAIETPADVNVQDLVITLGDEGQVEAVRFGLPRPGKNVTITVSAGPESVNVPAPELIAPDSAGRAYVQNS